MRLLKNLLFYKTMIIRRYSTCTSISNGIWDHWSYDPPIRALCVGNYRQSCRSCLRIRIRISVKNDPKRMVVRVHKVI